MNDRIRKDSISPIFFNPNYYFQQSPLILLAHISVIMFQTIHFCTKLHMLNSILLQIDASKVTFPLLPVLLPFSKMEMQFISINVCVCLCVCVSVWVFVTVCACVCVYVS